ncbi:M48 family metallopeptidase [candidate division KSB1 bacterium]|nr:M48 family metallopeptidase [candidate division KSB1 bacterium]
MNIYAIIILSAVILDFIVSLISDILNLRHLSPDLPETFKDVFDEDRYRKSQEYTRVTTRFGFLTSGFDLVITLIFWFAGGFNLLDQAILTWQLHPIWNGLLFIGILIFAKSILSLPFSIYSTFVIEERFGFNKTTLKTFVLDLVKGIALSLVIGGPLLAGILALFMYAGPIAWLYCWAVTTLFNLIIQFIAPTWIMPLFNKFTPLEEGELRKRILEYAKKVQYSLSGVFIIDGSKRSSKSNAFFTGFGKNKRIALFDTLIEKHTVPELVSVLAHEIGHYKKKHVITGMLISILHTGVLFFLLSLFFTQKGLFDAFYMTQISVYAGMLFFGMLYAPVEMILSILMHMLSRHHEFQADRFAIETTGDANAFINALKKLSAHNLSNLTPHPFHVFLNYSHPPVLQRIQTMQKMKPGI